MRYRRMKDSSGFKLACFLYQFLGFGVVAQQFFGTYITAIAFASVFRLAAHSHG